jgi:hypothetical protein
MKRNYFVIIASFFLFIAVFQAVCAAEEPSLEEVETSLSAADQKIASLEKQLQETKASLNIVNKEMVSLEQEKSTYKSGNKFGQQQAKAKKEHLNSLKSEQKRLADLLVQKENEKATKIDLKNRLEPQLIAAKEQREKLKAYLAFPYEKPEAIYSSAQIINKKSPNIPKRLTYGKVEIDTETVLNPRKTLVLPKSNNLPERLKGFSGWGRNSQQDVATIYLASVVQTIKKEVAKGLSEDQALRKSFFYEPEKTILSLGEHLKKALARGANPDVQVDGLWLLVGAGPLVTKALLEHEADPFIDSYLPIRSTSDKEVKRLLEDSMKSKVRSRCEYDENCDLWDNYEKEKADEEEKRRIHEAVAAGKIPVLPELVYSSSSPGWLKWLFGPERISKQDVATLYLKSVVQTIKKEVDKGLSEEQALRKSFFYEPEKTYLSLYDHLKKALADGANPNVRDSRDVWLLVGTGPLVTKALLEHKADPFVGSYLPIRSTSNKEVKRLLEDSMKSFDEKRFSLYEKEEKKENEREMQRLSEAMKNPLLGNSVDELMKMLDSVENLERDYQKDDNFSRAGRARGKLEELSRLKKILIQKNVSLFKEFSQKNNQNIAKVNAVAQRLFTMLGAGDALTFDQSVILSNLYKSLDEEAKKTAYGLWLYKKIPLKNRFVFGLQQCAGGICGDKSKAKE